MTEETPTGSEPSFDDAVTRIGDLVAYFEDHSHAPVRDAAFALLQSIDILHRGGVSRLVELLVAAHGEEVLPELAKDPVVGPLLELYDLLPSYLKDERTQVEDALEMVRPYMHSHGGEVELLDVEAGTVHVQLAGACNGCAGSNVTLKRGVEEALREGYAGYRELVVHDPPAPPAALIGLGELRASAERLRRPEWTVIAPVDAIPVGETRGFEAAGFPVLLTNVDGDIYGFRDNCPQCSMALHDGKLSGKVLVCPWQNCAYDARTGKPADDGSQRLEVYPVAITDGVVRLALNVLGAAPLSAE